MPTFDGDNLVITLDSGVTEVDVQDVYSAWKDWQLELPQNRGYPQAFRTIGGDPLTAIIDAGAYYFLRNDLGWRIRPPEEDITIYLTGNLAAEDATVDLIIPTVGAFTAAVIGIQPVTQGVSETLTEQVYQTAFLGGVALDPTSGRSIASPGTISDVSLLGTREYPLDNIADVKTIADQRGLRKIFVLADATIASIDLSGGAYTFVGDNPTFKLTLDASANVTGTSYELLCLEGQLDGANLLRDCEVAAVTALSGFCEKCAFNDTVTLSGELAMFECYSLKPGDAYPTFTTGANTLQVRDWHGSIGIDGATAGTSTVEIYGGRAHFLSGCTGGTFNLRGNYSDRPNDLSAGATVNDQSSTSYDLQLVRKLRSNRVVVATDGSTTTIYDDDGTTVLWSFTHASQFERTPV